MRNDGAGNIVNLADYSVDSPVDKTNDYHTKNLNDNLLTSLLKTTATPTTNNGLVCDFDVTDSIMDSDNTLKIYMYIANKGTGAKLLYCSDQVDPLNPVTDHCKYLSSYPDTNEIPGLIMTEGGFDLNVIEIKKGTQANTVSIKLNAGAEVN